MKKRVDGHGGVIAIDQHGNFGKACTTTVMVWATKQNDGPVKSEMMTKSLNLQELFYCHRKGKVDDFKTVTRITTKTNELESSQSCIFESTVS